MAIPDARFFPICVDWAASTVAMGRVQQYAREGRPIPADWGVEETGAPTTNPAKIKALLHFGAHKGYGLTLIDELYAGYIGGSLPTIRNRWATIPSGEKGVCCCFFQCARPDSLSGDNFAHGRSQKQNVQAILHDILAHGNDSARLPGQHLAQAAAFSAKHGGLLFNRAEVEAFEHIAGQAEFAFDATALQAVTV